MLKPAVLCLVSLLGSLLVALAGADEPTAPPSPVAPITQDQLVELQAAHPADVFLLDVRTPEEFAAGHIPGAHNVPHDQIASRLAEVPKDKNVVLYCRTGRRVSLASDVLTAHGYTELSHLDGDITAWIERGRPVEQP